MSKQLAIMKLLLAGRSYEQIVAEQHCSRRIITTVKKRLDTEQVTAVEQAEQLDEQQLAAWPASKKRVIRSHGPLLVRWHEGSGSAPAFAALCTTLESIETEPAYERIPGNSAMDSPIQI